MSSIIVDGIDFVLDLARGRKSKMGAVDRSAMSSSVMLCYLGFLMFWCFVWALRTNRHFSAVATAGAVLQCLGLTVMSIKVQGSKSVKGLSSQMLVLLFMMLCMRLTCPLLPDAFRSAPQPLCLFVFCVFTSPNLKVKRRMQGG